MAELFPTQDRDEDVDDETVLATESSAGSICSDDGIEDVEKVEEKDEAPGNLAEANKLPLRRTRAGVSGNKSPVAAMELVLSAHISTKRAMNGVITRKQLLNKAQELMLNPDILRLCHQKSVSEH